MGDTSLVNVGELSKPATVLIEKISAAVGGICLPYQIKRVAQAEAEADLIRAKSEIRISDLQRRAVQRVIAEEGKKQENMEAITQKALPLLEDKSQPQNLNDDWLAHFFEGGRIVSDQEMQQLWAKVLADEANSPGAFSKRTVSFLSTLEKREAVMFPERFMTLMTSG
jgi:hypothetical protein